MSKKTKKPAVMTYAGVFSKADSYETGNLGKKPKKKANVRVKADDSDGDDDDGNGRM